jgi:rubrerythrin
MTSSLIDNLIGQIEIFDALELKAVEDYTVIEKELTNSEFKDIVGQIRDDEIRHSKICREIIEFLKNRTPE